MFVIEGEGWPVGTVEHRGEDAVSEVAKPAPSPAASSWFTQLSNVLAALGWSMWQQARDREREGWPPWWLLLLAVLVAAAVLGFLVVPLVSALVWWFGARVGDVAGWGHEQAYARVVLDPVRGYLATHSGGLPVDGTVLWWTWCLAGGALLLFSLLRSVGARIGWVLYGVASTAMVVAGTPGPGRWIAGGICGLWWSLLSIPGLWMRRRLLVTVLPGPSSVTPAAIPAAALRSEIVPAEQGDPRPDDDAAWAADLYEALIRREQRAAPSAQRWTVTTHGVNGFTAVADDGRRAAGIAVSAEAVRDLLAGLSTPQGGCPQVAWTNAVPAAPQHRRMNYVDFQDPGSIRQFVDSSIDTLAELAAVLHERRDQWPFEVVEMQEKIVSQAVALNRAYPLVRGFSFVPNPPRDDRGHGIVVLHDWVPTETIVGGGGASSWNDFGSHRPEQVALIIRKLLTAPEPGRALAEILTDDGHVHLSRYHGPAGPIHDITVNGTHRTHALRLLGVPLVAAEVTVRPLPLRLDVFSTFVRDGWGQDQHRGPTSALWHALMERGLLSGRITGTGYQAILEPYEVTALWLLSSPRDAAAISAAYDRLYPGTLGIPPEAMSGAAQWCQWLLGDPRTDQPRLRRGPRLR